MKQIKKLSLSNLIGKLTRNKMRYVMAGSGDSAKKCGTCYSAYDCGSTCNMYTGRMDGSGKGDCGK
ncbi:hypothetical protein [Flavobacterium granuli]|uniref:Uncharacterized protein n=1 Tax=Flavobacterium granuli TaxID=280093 RepID=A0A1M5TZU3_9FLAO|nr:hypothetical protein [Flavobacterium granuli]PRZ22918.1 hypothetical protein BC624_106168 [Flavobacterium granuli]SHH56120.1 hypothetical protein SAMN05443373_11649 [Flavobacterium granuli]